MKLLESLRRAVRAPRVVKVIHVTAEPEGVAPAQSGNYRFELSLNSRELAALYALKGWQVQNATNDESIPGGSEIIGILANLADSISKGEFAYNTSARLMAVRDEDFPDVTDFYLYVGNAYTTPTDDIPDNLSEVSPV